MNRHLRRALLAYVAVRAYCNGDVSLTCDVVDDARRMLTVSFRVRGEHRFYVRYALLTDLAPLAMHQKLAELLTRVEDEISVRAIRGAVRSFFELPRGNRHV